MDEVEIYWRALSDKEIYSLYNVGGCGKCKITAHLPSVTPVCVNQASAVAYLTICNESTLPTTFTWELSPEPPNAPDCSFTGPAVFNPPSGSTTVPTNPGDCVSIPIVITRPDGFAPGDVGCYQVTVTANALDVSTLAQGALRGIYTWCDTQSGSGNRVIDIPPPDDTLPADSAAVVFNVRNDTTSGRELAYSIEALPGEGGSPPPLSLDGLAPGSTVTGSVYVPAGDSADVSVMVSFTRHSPFRIYSIMLSTDDDGDGTGEGISSTPVRSALGRDCNRNGIPDDEDIATGTSPDLDGNGVPDECEQPGPPSTCTGLIPTLTGWGIALLVLILGLAGMVRLRTARVRSPS